ncbi:CD109 antigen-like [Mya arenaria]|uniref:CD109 antigen-like n=1 Tax=Mya arenaria TaxID=6604 RepID=UPI0022E82C05|nr:CD109 antigen-like [Mya arenaria]
MDTIIPSRIVRGHDFVVICDLASAYNDVNNPMTGSHVIRLSLTPVSPNTFLPGIVRFPKKLKSGEYRGRLTVTKDGERVGNRYFNPDIHGDDVDRPFPLVQTDKGIYKAGQTVQFRILVINEQRKVLLETFTIDIFDADSNRVRRWANVSDISGVYFGRIELSNEPVLGEWTIKVSNENFTSATYFDVEELEYPKFYVEIDFPETVSTGVDDSLKGKVSALYTFGEGVSGDMELTLKYSSFSVVKRFKVKDGSVDINLPFTELSSDFKMSTSAKTIFNALVGYGLNSLRLDILVNVVEDVTGVNVSAKSYLDVRGEITRISGDPYPRMASADVDLMVQVKIYFGGRTITRDHLSVHIDKNNTISYTVEGEVLQADVSFINIMEQTRISFDVEEVRPGDAATIILKGNAGSNFYLLAVDKRILILDPGNDITESVWFYYTEIQLMEKDMTTARVAFTTTVDIGGTSPDLHSTTFAFETTSVFETYATTTNRQAETEERQRKSVTLRKKFPDTWLFNNVSSGEKGIAEFIATAPDTITTWVATCFAIDGNSRLSLAVRPAELQVFLPFFVSVQLPFSVIRNEQVVIQANVFNYHSEDIFVIVTLIKNDSFRGLAVSKRGKKRKLKEKCGNLVMCIMAKSGKATPAFFPIVPLEIGDIKLKITADSKMAQDTVVKKLRVEPEGAERSVAYPVFIDLTQKNTFNYSFVLTYPHNVVEGSERMRLTVTGDVMGSTLDNIEKLVRYPTGCGEQNMIKTAPSVFVMGYLTAIDRLDADLKKRAESFIGFGIQRQMNYKHSDWSFSVWGGSGSGSSWLTSFVLKVFSKGALYTDVDDRVITLPTEYLLSIQNKDGSFPERGLVGSRSMQGGSVGTDKRMTAYVLIALLEAQNAGYNNIQFSAVQERRLTAGIKKGMKFLERNLKNISSDYSLAITTFALGLGESRLASDALKKLMRKAKSVGGNIYDMLFWEEKAPVPSKYHYGPSTTAVSIEMTAYALLALSKAGDKVDGARVNKWLIGQSSPYGGFISTQDTMIGLEALAAFGAILKSQPTDMTIWVSYMYDSLQKQKFRITPENALLLQSVDLPTDSSEFNVHALGHSNAIVTVSLFYNIFMDLENQDLRLDVDVVNESVNGFTARSCISWLEDDISGMVVAEIGIPSGFNAFRYGISGHELLMRTEIQEKKVVLYFNQITLEKVCVDIRMVRDTLVASVKPVPCKVYEYYEPSNEMTVFYAPVKAKHSNICDVCGAECGCAGDNARKWMPLVSLVTRF